jgi:multidrug resistance efflux pump
MWIGAAGLGWQLAFGAVAFVAWKALEPYTLAARFCHVILGACGVTALFNLFPFIKLDGYYLLVDWLRVPNLREKAMRYLSARTRSLFFTVAPPQLAPRERRIYFWFGLSCWVSAALLLALLATRVARWMLGTWQGVGALLLGAFLMTLVLSWARGLFASAVPTAPPNTPAAPPSAPPARAAGDEKAQPPAPPAGSSGGGEPGAPKRVRPRLSAILLAAAVVVAGVVFWNAKWMRFVASPCTLEAARRTPVRPEVDGVLQETQFEEGEKVRRGDTFAVLESFDLVKRREQLSEEVKRVQAQTQVIAGQAPILETENTRDVEEAAREVRAARNELEDRSDLYPVRRAEADQHVQEAWSALESAKRVAERAGEDADGIAQGKLTPAMQAVRERIARVEAQKRLAEKEVNRAAFLVSQGALQRQKLDQVAAESEMLTREETALGKDLEALQKDVVEKREDAEAEVRRRQATYAAALEAKRLVERETRPERLETAQEEVRGREQTLATTRRLRAAAALKRVEAAVKGLEARPKAVEMERLERKIHQTRVPAPVSGVVSTPRLSEKIGRRFARGETIAWIDRIDTLLARISVDERDIGEVKRGQNVQLRVGAFPDRMFDGKVEAVSPRAGPGGGKGAYEVRVRIPNPSGELRPGITGYAKIYCGRRPLREVVFRRLHRYLRTEVWTWF